MSAGQANYVTHIYIDKPHYSESSEGFIVEGVTSAVRHNCHSQNNETTGLHNYYNSQCKLFTLYCADICQPCNLANCLEHNYVNNISWILTILQVYMHNEL